MASPAAVGGAGGAAEAPAAAAPAPDFSPEEAAKCVTFVRTILRMYGSTDAILQDLVTNMDTLGEHYAMRFAEKMDEIDRDDWDLYEVEVTEATTTAAAAVGERLAPLLRGKKYVPKMTSVYEVILPRSNPPRVRFIKKHSSAREALSYVSAHIGRGEIPPIDKGSESKTRYSAMMAQIRMSHNAFFSGNGSEFMVIPDESKDLPALKEGVHHVVV
jgi:hypothetical protein